MREVKSDLELIALLAQLRPASGEQVDAYTPRGHPGRRFVGAAQIFAENPQNGPFFEALLDRFAAIATRYIRYSGPVVIERDRPYSAEQLRGCPIGLVIGNARFVLQPPAPGEPDRRPFEVWLLCEQTRALLLQIAEHGARLPEPEASVLRDALDATGAAPRNCFDLLNKGRTGDVQPSTARVFTGFSLETVVRIDPDGTISTRDAAYEHGVLPALHGCSSDDFRFCGGCGEIYYSTRRDSWNCGEPECKKARQQWQQSDPKHAKTRAESRKKKRARTKRLKAESKQNLKRKR